MKTIAKFFLYLTTRLIVMALISWGISSYLVRDPKFSTYELIRNSNSGLEQAARALRP